VAFLLGFGGCGDDPRSLPADGDIWDVTSLLTIKIVAWVGIAKGAGKRYSIQQIRHRGAVRCGSLLNLALFDNNQFSLAMICFAVL